MGNQLNKIPAANVIIGGLYTPPPGLVEAVFHDLECNGGEVTAPVLALFIRQDVNEYGIAISLDGFTAGGAVEELFPVSELDNFRGFRFAGATDSHLGGGESGKCRYCGNRAETDKSHGACAACLAANNLALAVQGVREATV